MLPRSGPTVAAALSSLECRPARRCRSPVESEPVQLPASGTWPLVLIVESDAIGEGQQSSMKLHEKRFVWIYWRTDAWMLYYDNSSSSLIGSDELKCKTFGFICHRLQSSKKMLFVAALILCVHWICNYVLFKWVWLLWNLIRWRKMLNITVHYTCYKQ